MQSLWGSQRIKMFVDPNEGMDCNSGLTPDEPLATIAMAMNRTAEDRTGITEIFLGQLKKKKKELADWPPKPDNLNEEWWK